jgi:hypothetical protein
MAQIIGGFAVSHTPTIAFAQDAGKQDDPVWKPIFDGFEPVKQWLADNRPDVIVYVYNDHMTSFGVYPLAIRNLWWYIMAHDNEASHHRAVLSDVSGR